MNQAQSILMLLQQGHGRKGTLLARIKDAKHFSLSDYSQKM